MVRMEANTFLIGSSGQCLAQLFAAEGSSIDYLDADPSAYRPQSILLRNPSQSEVVHRVLLCPCLPLLCVVSVPGHKSIGTSAAPACIALPARSFLFPTLLHLSAANLGTANHQRRPHHHHNHSSPTPAHVYLTQAFQTRRSSTSQCQAAKHA